MAITVDGEERARRIVDDRGEVARFGAFLRVARLQRLQRLVERRPKHIEPAAAGIGKPLRIILEAHRFDEPRDEEVGAANEIPEARECDDTDEPGDDEPGTNARRGP